jgi:hypothetical protein
MKDQVMALRTDITIVEGQELITYLLEHPTRRTGPSRGGSSTILRIRTFSWPQPSTHTSGIC